MTQISQKDAIWEQEQKAAEPSTLIDLDVLKMICNGSRGYSDTVFANALSDIIQIAATDESHERIATQPIMDDMSDYNDLKATQEDARF